MFIFYWYISFYCWSLEFKELHQVLWWHWACRNGWVNPFWPIGRLQTKIGGCHNVFLPFHTYRGEGWTASSVEYVTSSEFSPHLKLPSIFPIRESLLKILINGWIGCSSCMFFYTGCLFVEGYPTTKYWIDIWPTGFPKLKKVHLRNTPDCLPSLYILKL